MSDSDEEVVEKQLKVVFVGESSVGKTNIIRRFCYDEFTRLYSQTVGADFYIKRIALPKKQEITLRITDIGGLELQGSMLDKYLFKSDIIIVVYDITNSASFDLMVNWINTIKRIDEKAPILAIFGNKCDLEHQRAVRLDRTRQFVQDYNITAYLMSAKTGEAVSSSMLDLVARHLGIPLTKIQREQQQAVIKPELVPPVAETARPSNSGQNNSAVCFIQ